MKKNLLLLSVICMVTFLSLSAYPDLIKSFEIINKNKIVVKADKVFSKQFIKEDFFAEYDESVDLSKLDESIVTIPFILNIIPVVWFSNETYSIDVMDKDLYHSLQKVKEVFQAFYPHHSWSGELVPQKLVTNTFNSSNGQNRPRLALLFSGGLDSVNTSINYIDTKQLLITAWGADVKVQEENKWARVLEHCRKFSQIYGHDHTFVKSNFREFVETRYLYAQFPRWWVRVSHALSFVGLVAPLLVVYDISTLFISSTYTLKHPYPYGSHPAIDNNISFTGRNVYHTDADKDRIEKIINITNVCKEKNISRPRLQVCWSDPKGGNCLKCDKCLRTIFNIIVAGQLPKEFGFNIEVSAAIQALKRFFLKKKYLKNDLKDDSIMFWQNNWLYLAGLPKQAKANSVLSGQDIKILRKFLQSIKLTRYRNPRTHICSSQERELFETLWQQSMRRVNV